MSYELILSTIAGAAQRHQPKNEIRRDYVLADHGRSKERVIQGQPAS